MDEQARKKMFQKTFDTVAEGYDNPALRFFPQSAKHLVALLNLKGDEHILDVATGTGNVALELADNVPDGRVTGIDFSGGMLAQARKKVETQQIRNIVFQQMDMQSLDFPDDHFDAAVSAFSLFFVSDMEEQLRHIARKVRPGGKIITATFFESAFSPLVTLFLDRLRAYSVEIPPLTWKKVATPEQCVALFGSANLNDVSSHVKDCGYYLKDRDDWWYIIWNGGFRGLVSQLSPHDLDRFREEHLREVQELSSARGIRLEMSILFTIGTRI